jgi:catechol 2,3-dioxygenase-like lactoylglutathione lyase family enzyme
MRVRRLAWLGTRTENFDETTAFFRDVLGIPMIYEESGFTMLQLPDADRDFVEIFDRDHPSAVPYSTGPAIGLLVDDIEQARIELEAARIEILGPTTWLDSMLGYGWFHVRAPDGNVYAIMQDSPAPPG